MVAPDSVPYMAQIELFDYSTLSEEMIDVKLNSYYYIIILGIIYLCGNE